MKSSNDILRAYLGATAKPGDSDYWLMRRIAAAAGVGARSDSSFRDLLFGVAKARGASPRPGDSVFDLLRRMSGLTGAGASVNNLLVVVFPPGGGGGPAIASSTTLLASSDSILASQT